MATGIGYGVISLDKCPAGSHRPMSRRTMTMVPACRDENTMRCGRLGVSMTKREQVLRVAGPFGFESKILKMGKDC